MKPGARIRPGAYLRPFRQLWYLISRFFLPFCLFTRFRRSLTGVITLSIMVRRLAYQVEDVSDNPVNVTIGEKWSEPENPCVFYTLCGLAE
jgi:hypothetical protein